MRPRLSIAFSFSFSQLVFGAIPDSFAVSGAVIAGLLWLVSLPEGGRYSTAKFAIATFLAAGVTITNVVIAASAVVIATYRRNESLVSPLRNGAVLSLAAVAASFLLMFLARSVYSSDAEPVAADLYGQAKTFMARDPGARAAAFPAAVLASVIPVTVATVAAPSAAAKGDYPFRFSIASIYENAWVATVGFCLTVLVCGVLARCWRLIEDRARRLLVLALLTLIFNWALHSLWGEELLSIFATLERRGV